MAFALVAERHAVAGAAAVAVVHADEQLGRADAVPFTAHAVVGRGVDGRVDQALCRNVGFRDEQRRAVLWFGALLLCIGLKNMQVGKTDFSGGECAGVRVHNVILLLLLIFKSFFCRVECGAAVGIRHKRGRSRRGHHMRAGGVLERLFS